MKQHVRFCTTQDGVTLAYATVGTGPPLVRTANWLSHLEHDWRTPLWRPFLARLARGRTLVRYDQRGCGLSDWEVDDISFDAWIADVEAVVEAAGLDRFPLLGISQGAAVAMAYAVAHPEQVSGLALYGGFARGVRARDPTPRQREEAETLLRLIRLGWGREDPVYRNVFASLFLPEATLEQMRAFSELQRLSTTAVNAERIVAAFEGIDVQELATRVRVPTLVLHVRGDARVPFEEGRLLASLIPEAEFVGVDGRNHVLLPGDPAFDQVGDEIDRFLDAGHAVPYVGSVVTKLTRRETEVLDLIASGLDNAAIARRLFISPNTVRNHITSIFAKLGVARRPEAIVLGREAGLGRRGEAEEPRRHP